jgi:hypothetical protein
MNKNQSCPKFFQDRMHLKSVLTLPFSFIISAFHIACCVLPLLAAASYAMSYAEFFVAYKPFFTAFQVAMIAFLLVRLLRYYFLQKAFHSRLENISFHLSLALSLAGFYIGYAEPFQSEKQQIAQQQFAYFKAHRKVELSLSGNFDPKKLKADLAGIQGVKMRGVTVADKSVEVPFQNDLVSKTQILKSLRSKGYDVIVLE